ncbi:MAG: peptidase, partial [Rhodopirellula sp. JB053]
MIFNNVVERSGNVGIQIGGGTYDNGEYGTPNLFSRVVNNTVVTAGVGIEVSGRAAPTLMNNVIVDTDTGIEVDTVEASGTVTARNVFSRNGVDSTLPLSSTSFVIPDGDPVFQDEARSIYLPAEGSLLIDNSLNSLSDRADFVDTVKTPIGIASSPILAPSFDIYGQPRVDGIAGSPSGGVGLNPFIDRGAVDRADFRRPNAVLNNPFDAPDEVAAGSPTDPNTTGDTDPQQSFVRLVNSDQFVEYFEIQLIDEAGTGLDADTINGDTVLMTENGEQLLPGRDFTFGYSENSRTIRLTPLSGVWNQDAVYEITLNNQARRVIELQSGGSIADGDQVVVTDDTGRETVLEFDSGYTLAVPQNDTFVVTDTKDGFQDTDTFSITSRNGLTTYTFEINTTGSVASANVAIPLSATGTVTEVRDAILSVLVNNPPNAASYAEQLGLAPVAVGSDSIQLGTLPAVQSGNPLPGHVINMGNISSGLIKTGTVDSVVDGGAFTYTRGDTTITFEFDSNDSFDPADQTATYRRVEFSRTDTPDQIADSIATALRGSNIDLSGAISIGNGLVSVGGLEGDVVDLLDSELSLTGTPGVTSSLNVTVPGTQSGSTIDGTTVTISVGSKTETFLFTIDPQLTSANITVVVDPTADSTEIAQALEAAVALTFENELNVQRSGDVITLGETASGQGSDFTTVDIVPGPAVVGDALLVGGVSGGAIPVQFTPSDSFPAVSVATKVQQAISEAGIGVDVFSPGGGVLLLSGTQEVVTRGGVGAVETSAETILAISDLAGNPVNPTRPNNETRFTIIMPDVRFDFGDAPAEYGTLLQTPTPGLDTSDANYIPGNGARHAVSGGSSSRLGRYVDTESDGQPVGSGIGVSDDRVLTVGATSVAGDVITPTFARITVTAMPRIGDVVTITVLTPDPANPGAFIGTTDYEFEFVNAGATANGPGVEVEIASGDDVDDVTASLFAAIQTHITNVEADLDAAISATASDEIELESVSVGGARAREFVIQTQSALTAGGFTVDDSNPNSLSVTFTAVPVPGQLLVLRTADRSQTYEFVDPASNPRPGSVPVLIQPTFTPEEVAEALLNVVQSSLSEFGGSILSEIDANDASTVTLTAIDDEDGVSVITFNQGGSNPPAYFFGSYEDNGMTFDASQSDRVFGFLNPADPVGTNVEVFVTGGGLIDAWVDFNG